MNEIEFEELREHLKVVVPYFEEFCLEHGFYLVDSRSLGRYPRIRIEKTGEINYWIELWMCLDEKGMRFTKFFDEIPYDLDVGVYMDQSDNTEFGQRFQLSKSKLTHTPFFRIPPILNAELKECLNWLIRWNKTVLIKQGNLVNLG